MTFHTTATAALMAICVASSGARLLSAQSSAPTRRTVTFLRDETTNVRRDTIRLLGGSVWRTSGTTLLLPVSTVIIVRSDSSRFGILYADGIQEVVTHVSGAVAWEGGTLTTVVRRLAEGAVLQTADGRLWDVPSYDRYDSGWWLPTFPALITSSELYLFNLKKVKRIWVSPAK